MSVDTETVGKIARLARIAVEPEAREALTGSLNRILDFIEQLDSVDTDGVPPLANVSQMTAKLRPDVVSDGGYVDQVLQNAPESEEGFFAVPKVVE